MPLPKEVLALVADDIKKAEDSLVELKDIVTDMRLSGMDTAKRDDELDDLKDKLRNLKVFYDRQKAKSK